MVRYILHAALLVSSFYLFYKLFLEKETFFRLNRGLLAGCIVLAFGLPALTIPSGWSLWNETPSLSLAVIENSRSTPETAGAEAETGLQAAPLENPAGPSARTSIPTERVRPEGIEGSLSGTVMAEPAQSVSAPARKPLIRFSALQILTFIYLAGLAVFGLNFFVQLGLLMYMRISRPAIRDGRYRIVELGENQSPYSFWNNIFINPARYDWDTFNQILQHEKIHVAQRHSLDILLAELMVIIQWFNPFAWMYRKAVENNLEFLTDDSMLATGAHKQTYQMSLLKVCAPQLPLNLTTNYNQSILKRRIVMMNSKKSSVGSGWKYFILVPLVGLSVLTLNAVRTTAQPAPVPDTELTVPELPAIPPVKFEKLRLEDVTPAPFAEKSGEWRAWTKDGELCLEIGSGSNGSRWHNWVISDCYPKSAFTGLTPGAAEFKMIREAGTMVFTGKFDGNEGEGKFSFTESSEFRSYLAQEGFTGLEDETMLHLFLADINKAWFAYLKQNGYTRISDEELRAAAIHGVTLPYLKEALPAFQAAGLKGLDLRDLIQFQIHDVTPAYVREMKDLGYKDFSAEEIVEASIHDVNPEYIRSLKAAGYGNLPMETLVQFSIHDVNADYVKALDDAGFRKLTPEEIVQFSIHDVNADFIKGLKSAGMGDMSAEEVVQYAIHDVDPAFINSLKKAGFSDLTRDEIVQLAIHGVDTDYMNGLKAAGLQGLDVETITQFAIHDVDAEYIKALQQAGIKNLGTEEIVQFAIHDVDASFVKALQQSGITDLSNDDIVELAIHGVDADFVKDLRAAGFDKMSADEIAQLAIHDVDADYIKELRDLGLKLSLDEAVQASIHDIQPALIKDLQSLGYKNMGIDEVVQLGIHDVDGRYIRSLNDLGFKDIPVDLLVQCRIHDLSASDIREMRSKGKENLTLEQYLEQKLEHESDWYRSRKKQE